MARQPMFTEPEEWYWRQHSPEGAYMGAVQEGSEEAISTGLPRDVMIARRAARNTAFAMLAALEAQGIGTDSPVYEAVRLVAEKIAED